MASSKDIKTIGSERVVVATSANSEVLLSLLDIESGLTAGEQSDVSMGMEERQMDAIPEEHSVKIVPWSLLPGQLIRKYKRRNPDWNEQH